MFLGLYYIKSYFLIKNKVNDYQIIYLDCMQNLTKLFVKQFYYYLKLIHTIEKDKNYY